MAVRVANRRPSEAAQQLRAAINFVLQSDGAVKYSVVTDASYPGRGHPRTDAPETVRHHRRARTAAVGARRAARRLSASSLSLVPYHRRLPRTEPRDPAHP